MTSDEVERAFSRYIRRWPVRPMEWTGRATDRVTTSGDYTMVLRHPGPRARLSAVDPSDDVRRSDAPESTD